MNGNLSSPATGTAMVAGRRFSRPLLALAPVIVTFLVQLALWPIIQPFAWFLFTPAVFFSAWIGGLRLGTIGSISATLLIVYFFLPVEHTFVIRTADVIVVALMFSGMGVVFSVFLDRVKRSEQRAIEAHANSRYQAQLESVFQAIGEGVVVTDMEGRILMANEAVARTMGLTPEAIKQDLAARRQLYELRDPDGRLVPFEEWPANRVIRGESITNLELHARRPDTGQEWSFSFNGQPVRDEAGRQILAVVGTRDITEQRRSEDSLRASEGRFKAMFENASVGICRVAPDGRFLEVNPRLCDIVCHPKEELLTKTFGDITYPDDLQAGWDLAKRLLAGSIETYCMEKRYCRKDGSIVWAYLTVSLVRHKDHSPDYFVAVVEDISARKEAEQKLRDSEERLAGIVSSAMDAIITVDEDHRVILFNEAAEKVFGCPAAEVMGQTLDRFIPELFRNGNPVAGSGETGGAGSSQASLHALTAFRADGAAFPIEAAISSTEIGGRNLLTIIHRDVTERRQAEAEREQLAREQAARTTAEAANRSKDDFLALVSHELRSPLTAILGYARLLRSDLADRETVNRGAAVIERSAKSQLQIIEDLLDSARIASGKLRIEFERVDLVPVVEAALDTARPAAEAKGISLVADFGPAREQLLGDSTRLQQVVWNLLSNAVKFTPEAGRVELEMKASGDDIKITVTDNGSGIEPSFLPSVFERFRQADSSSTRRVGGLGVGLSLVKHLVELHGGTITAQSGGPGRGSRFTVALPRQRIEFMAPTGSAAGPGEMPATDAPTLDRTASLEGVNVLVVDDQEDARVLLTRALTEFGARVTAVSSGMEALSMLRNSPSGARFDALILDIAMPGEDGYAVLKKVRALELDERVAERMPAIALTAFAGSEDKTRALQAGFQIHVAKPVEPAELAGVINSLVNRRMRGRGRGHRA